MASGEWRRLISWQRPSTTSKNEKGACVDIGEEERVIIVEPLQMPEPDVVPEPERKPDPEPVQEPQPAPESEPDPVRKYSTLRTHGPGSLTERLDGHVLPTRSAYRDRSRNAHVWRLSQEIEPSDREKHVCNFLANTCSVGYVHGSWAKGGGMARIGRGGPKRPLHDWRYSRQLPRWEVCSNG